MVPVSATAGPLLDCSAGWTAPLWLDSMSVPPGWLLDLYKGIILSPLAQKCLSLGLLLSLGTGSLTLWLDTGVSSPCWRSLPASDQDS